jgi:hypothetical protein
VAVLEGQRLAIISINSPVTDPKMTVTVNEETVAAEPPGLDLLDEAFGEKRGDHLSGRAAVSCDGRFRANSLRCEAAASSRRWVLVSLAESSIRLRRQFGAATDLCDAGRVELASRSPADVQLTDRLFSSYRQTAMI